MKISALNTSHAVKISAPSVKVTAQSQSMSVSVDTASVSVSAEADTMTIKIGEQIVRDTGDYPAYTGETTVTPTQETQTLSTNGTVLLKNITVNPIPSNYGLITWNGSVLTVS